MRWLRPYVIGGALGALALGLVPLVGLVSHDATTGPGATGWYHWLAARQSVTLRSLTTPVPPLDDPAMARRAAGHYEMVCAACHGSPAGPPERFADDLWPRPPRLTEAAARWRPPARVFQTVKAGVARTAMPGWPVDTRDDEVWDMVAFLARLPDLSAEAYAAMAGPAGGCTHCHGENGEGRDGIPRLDIQTPEYLAAALRAYRDGTRASGTMMAAARRLTDTDITELAARFGRRLPAGPPLADHPAAAIASHGATGRDVPACLSCHGAMRRTDYPALAGQDADYLRRQLALFSGEHGEARGGRHGQTMAKAARWLRPTDIEMLADWFSRQPVPPGTNR